mmetsp:Transcript_13932/g.45783  ORF Transcript_13932/g.45783 Transcript_13932/m.45783 type:complete len:548 (+) Transcript_13932:49-1692(+)
MSEKHDSFSVDRKQAMSFFFRWFGSPAADEDSQARESPSSLERTSTGHHEAHNLLRLGPVFGRVLVAGIEGGVLSAADLARLECVCSDFRGSGACTVEHAREALWSYVRPGSANGAGIVESLRFVEQRARSYVSGGRPLSASGNGFWVVADECGDLHTAGYGELGRLGHGTFVDEPAPRRVLGLPERVLCVSAGWAHSAVVGMSGKVYTWGHGGRGQLGLGNKQPQHVPQLVPGLRDIVDVSAGGYHTLALTADGRTYSWGDGEHGELGHGNEATALRPREMRLGEVANLRVQQVSAGSQHTVLVADKGVMLTCGDAACCGHGQVEHVLEPRVVQGLPPIARAAGGLSFTMAVTVSGAVYAWGPGTCGHWGPAAGAQATTEKLLPRRLNLECEPAQSCALAAAHVLVVTRSGEVHAFGRGGMGALGNGSIVPGPHFNVGPMPGARHVVHATCGGSLNIRGAGWAASGFVTADGRMLTVGGGPTQRFLAHVSSANEDESWRVGEVPKLTLARHDHLQAATKLVALQTSNRHRRASQDDDAAQENTPRK